MAKAKPKPLPAPSSPKAAQAFLDKMTKRLPSLQGGAKRPGRDLIRRVRVG